MAAKVRAEHIAVASILEERPDREIAEELGLTRASLANWKSRNRTVLNSAFDAATEQVRRLRTEAAAALQVRLANEVEMAAMFGETSIAAVPSLLGKFSFARMPSRP